MMSLPAPLSLLAQRPGQQGAADGQEAVIHEVGEQPSPVTLHGQRPQRCQHAGVVVQDGEGARVPHTIRDRQRGRSRRAASRSLPR